MAVAAGRVYVEEMTHAAPPSWTLPWRGLGLSSNLSMADVPQPYRLLDASPGLFDYVEYSAPLSLEESKAHASLFPEMWRRRQDVPVLFHPVHLNLWGPGLEPARALVELDAHARAVESPWVGNDVGWWHVEGQPFPGYLYFTPPFNEAGLEASVAHALHVQRHLSMPLALENPAVLARRGQWHVLDFMAKLHARTGAPLLLDLGHLFSHQLSAGLPLETGLEGFPLDQVIELHIAGGVVTHRGPRRFYVDDHTQPVREELFELLASLIPRCPSLRAVTFEGDGHPPEVAAASLRRLRELVPAGARPPLTWRVPEASAAPVPALTEDSQPWALFDAGYGAAPVTSVEDEAGTLADQDFRLAVVAEVLDRDWPLTRLLLAGTREALAAFTGSKEFRKLFSPLGRSPGQAFASWAMRRLRESPDEGGSAALTLEMLLPSLFLRRVPAPAPGQVGLLEDVRAGSLPVDLSELVHAARAVRRHLTARAWASGALELSGLESLNQVARRAGPGPWSFTARRRAGGLEVTTVSPAMGEFLRMLAVQPLTEAEVAPGLVEEARQRGLIRRG
ncbi:DUF692 domain-containing protein [Corallococcus macrosporus]|uniref:DUF692 domain-containing protein n=1 Tax=Myxococcus fulvus (strain ATCC BAA-855 / HW-1) TaxID=483219 RepID=F8CKB7_MYXFH|nr:DUF692 family multinuclear iron-containing protein [Corallococcus macrosporus]AEI67673.1 hypothetical protein LILAB_28960 [Corallococcus macrosporus]